MEKYSQFAPLVARIFIGALFLIAGFGKLSDVAGFAGYMSSAGVPAFLAWPAVIFEIALGVSMILGYQTRVMALLGAGFCILAALIYHTPTDPEQQSNFLKNLAIAGGFLMLFAHGAGPVAVDKR